MRRECGKRMGLLGVNIHSVVRCELVLSSGTFTLGGIDSRGNMCDSLH